MSSDLKDHKVNSNSDPLKLDMEIPTNRCKLMELGDTLFGRYDGSHTTFFVLAVSPSDVTPHAFPSSSNSTCKYGHGLSKTVVT